MQTAKSTSRYSSRNNFFVQSLIIMGAMNYGSSGWKDWMGRHGTTVGGGSMVYTVGARPRQFSSIKLPNVDNRSRSS